MCWLLRLLSTECDYYAECLELVCLVEVWKRKPGLLEERDYSNVGLCSGIRLSWVFVDDNGDNYVVHEQSKQVTNLIRGSRYDNCIVF